MTERVLTRRPVCGFTLIELLIALAMISLITLLLFSGLRLGSRAWEGVDAAAERIGSLRLAHNFLERTLTQARPATVIVDAGVVPVFAGEPERLELAAPLSEHVGVPGVYILRLTLEGDGDRRNLVLTRWLIHPEVLAGGDEIPAWQPMKDDTEMLLKSLPLDTDAAAGAFGRTLLLEGVDGFGIRYFGALEGESEPDWHEDWLDQGSLPALVRIHLTSTEQSWPDLVVALPLGTSSAVPGSTSTHGPG